MHSELLIELFRFAQRAFRLNVAGISHQESLIHVTPEVNSFNWVAGHISLTRDEVLSILGASRIWTDDEARAYRRGAERREEAQLDLEEIVARYEAAQSGIERGLQRAMENIQDERDRQQLAETLSRFHFHEAYHIGQLGLLRRLLKKEGAIK